LPYPLRVIYLHGFASSPSSRKAQYLSERFRECSIRLETPDLAEANFENLTITGQLALLERLTGNDRVSLIGSSLGGYLAALYAATHSNVDRLVLLAPAFRFVDLWRARLGAAELKRWRETDQLAVYHYGEDREVNLRYSLLADAERYEAYPDFSQPALIVHGRSDDTVPIESTFEFARTHPNVRVLPLDSDHELGNVLQPIWEQTQQFVFNADAAKSVLG
jgi:uncharacterized protein